MVGGGARTSLKPARQSGAVITHPLAPVCAKASRTLLLGTMPSPTSRASGFYYAHPQNRFWPVLAAVYGEPVPADNEARAQMILRHDLALWDVLRRCEITGASDASILHPEPNDIASLLANTQISRVLTTGATATKLYRRLVEPVTAMPCMALPSTSAANARMPLGALIEIYRRALQADGSQPTCK